jgi:hypothetical protein
VPPTAAPLLARSENVPLSPLAVALNEPHRPARACTPETKAVASDDVANW